MESRPSAASRRGTIYDGYGNRKETIENRGTPSLSTDDRTNTYAYDKRNRLTQVIVDEGTDRENITTKYSYDAVGNKTSEIDVARPRNSLPRRCLESRHRHLRRLRQRRRRRAVATTGNAQQFHGRRVCKQQHPDHTHWYNRHLGAALQHRSDLQRHASHGSGVYGRNPRIWLHFKLSA